MPIVDLLPTAGLFTFLAAYLVWSNVWRLPSPPQAAKEGLLKILVAISVAVMLYAIVLLDPVTEEGIHFKLVTSLAIATLLVQSMYLIGLFRHGIQGLGLFLLPVTASILLLAPVIPQEETNVIHTTSALETGHLVISLLAYAMLTLAAFHALMHLILDRALKRKQFTPIEQAMPSLFDIEDHLIAQVKAATVLIGISILSGLSWQWFELQHIALLNHKVLLALFSFGVLVLLLIKRQQSAWRSRTISKVVLSAYGLLLLAYFGVRLIQAWMS